MNKRFKKHSPPKKKIPAADEAYNQGLRYHKAGKSADATTLFNRAIELDPEHPHAWNGLGVAFRAGGTFAAAVACYRRHLENHPKDATVLTNLGNALKDLDRLDEAIDAHQAAIASSKEPAYMFNLGITQKQAGDLVGALASVDAACEAAPEYPEYQWERALILLALGRFEEGWPAYEWRWRLPHHPPHPMKVPQWTGEDFSGKTLLVHPEQGFGDSILASRFLPLVKARGGFVVMECKPEIMGLFSSLEGVDRQVPRGGSPPADVDLQCPVMSLMGIFGAIPDQLPPPPRLYASAGAHQRWRPLFRPDRSRFKVGFIWSGRPTFQSNRNRSTSLENFLGLAEVANVRLYSLQMGEQREELARLGLGSLVPDLGDRITSFSETAAILEHLDLVIMTDSATAHLTGALGRPVWNLLNFVPYWLYGQEGETTPWYPSMRLFRQTGRGDWPGVFSRVKEALAQAVQQNRQGKWPPPTVF